MVKTDPVPVLTPGTCRECGGPKPGGRGRKFCDACLPIVQARESAKQSVRTRAYYRQNRAAALERNQAWADAHPDRVAEIKRDSYARELASGKRRERTLARFGLTPAQYDELLASQGGVCAICGKQDRRRLNVDHEHSTGEVRGLLCSGCNGARLGRLADSPERADTLAAEYEERARHLRSAAEYLRNPPARSVLRGESDS